MSTGSQITRELNVPVEILLLIISFVSIEDLWTFYGVNKFLTNVCLNHRYGSLLLNPDLAPDGVPVHQTRRLRHLSRVVSLRIDARPTPFNPADHHLPKILPVQKKFKNKASHWFLNTRGRLLRAVGLLDDAKTLTRTVQQLTNVSSLSIGRVGRKPWRHMINTAWNTFGKTLTTLRLDIPPELLDTVIHDSLFLPKLATFHFRVLPWLATGMSSTQVVSTIVPFLNRHYESLETLELGFPWPQRDAADFFNNLHHMPHLHSFSFYPENHPVDPISIHRWLGMHSAHLCELSLQGSSSSPERKQIFLQGLTLSHLTRLSLLLCNQGPLDTSTLGFVQRHSHTLRSFQVWSLDPAQDKLIALLHCFPITTQTLKSLSLSLKYLTPAIVDILAERFPELVELDIDVLGFRHRAYTIEVTPDFPHLHQFCAEMRTRSYKDWKLRHLSLLNGRSHRIQGCGALVLALPNLLTVEGISRRGFLEGHFTLIPGSRDLITD